MEGRRMDAKDTRRGMDRQSWRLGMEGCGEGLLPKGKY